MPNVPPVVIPEKSIWKSRVLLLNAGGLLVIVLGIVIDSATTLHLPPDTVGYLGVALAILNAILRFNPGVPPDNG